MMNNKSPCRHCGGGIVKSWPELSEDERKVVAHLPASAEYSRDERERTHRWCTRCWHETGNHEELA